MGRCLAKQSMNVTARALTTEQAIRFVEEGTPHDVVVVVDNSLPSFATPEAFKGIFIDALAQALTSKTLALTRASHGWATDVCASPFTEASPKSVHLDLAERSLRIPTFARLQFFPLHQ